MSRPDYYSRYKAAEVPRRRPPCGWTPQPCYLVVGRPWSRRPLDWWQGSKPTAAAALLLLLLQTEVLARTVLTPVALREVILWLLYLLSWLACQKNRVMRRMGGLKMVMTSSTDENPWSLMMARARKPDRLAWVCQDCLGSQVVKVESTDGSC